MSYISILLPDLRGGGAERVNLDLAYEFARAGHKVEFVLMQARGEFMSEAKAAFSIVDLNCPQARNLPRILARYLRQHRPDALLAAMWPLTVIAPLMRLVGYRGRIVLSEHCVLSAQYDGWGRAHWAALRGSMALSFPLADACVAVSAGVADDISAITGLRRQMFGVIHNPIPPRPEPSANSVSIAESLWSCPNGGRIVTVGSMKGAKNHPLLLCAFAQLDRPDARLMFVGDGEGREELVLLAKQLGVADRVIFAGFRHDPTPFYKSADLFVLSSDYEGFGNVIVEALAMGTPVVSTDCPSGPAEILENSKYGHLVPVGNPKALADAMLEALTAPHDPELLKQRSADFAPAIAAKRYLELLCP